MDVYKDLNRIQRTITLHEWWLWEWNECIEAFVARKLTASLPLPPSAGNLKEVDPCWRFKIVTGNSFFKCSKLWSMQAPLINVQKPDKIFMMMRQSRNILVISIIWKSLENFAQHEDWASASKMKRSLLQTTATAATSYRQTYKWCLTILLFPCML